MTGKSKLIGDRSVALFKFCNTASMNPENASLGVVFSESIRVLNRNLCLTIFLLDRAFTELGSAYPTPPSPASTTLLWMFSCESLWSTFVRISFLPMKFGSRANGTVDAGDFAFVVFTEL